MLLKLSKDFSKTNIIIVIDEKHKAQTKNWQTKNIKHTKKKDKKRHKNQQGYNISNDFYPWRYCWIQMG